METAGQSATNPYAGKRAIQSESGRLTQTAYAPYVARAYTYAHVLYVTIVSSITGYGNH